MTVISERATNIYALHTFICISGVNGIIYHSVVGPFRASTTVDGTGRRSEILGAKADKFH